MSDLDQNQENQAELEAAELDALKAKADMLGIKFHPNISAEKLSAKVKQHLETDVEEEVVADPVSETPGQKIKRIKDAALALVRVNISCMNPHKTEWDGEIFTVGNSAIPTQRKFVPFNTKDGYHIPQIMYDMIDARQCQVFETVKKNGIKVRQGKLIKEFNLAILPPLTKAELAELAKVQAVAGVIE